MITTFETSPLVANIKAAERAASKDYTRLHLACIRLELDGNTTRFIATNGHWMWVNEVTTCDTVGTDRPIIHIRQDEVRRILGALNKTKAAASFLPIVLDTMARTLTQGPLTLGIGTDPCPEGEDRFPPYRQVFPGVHTFDTSTGVNVIAAAYLADVAASMADVAQAPKDCSIRYHSTSDQYGPSVFTSSTSSAVAVVMGVRDETPLDGLRTLARYAGVSYAPPDERPTA